MSEIVNTNPEPPPFPHILWKQIIGLIISSVIFFFFGGILPVVTGILTFADAWNAGIYKKSGERKLLNISPMAWGIVMQGLMIVAYPLYLINRNKLKTREGKPVLFGFVIVLGGITLTLAIYQIIFWAMPKN
jgi:hypothetical protein